MVSLKSDRLPLVGRDWHNLAPQSAKEIFQATFAEASVLPGREILDVARRQSRTMNGPTTIVLAGSDDFWSVYVVGAIWLAVEAEHGHTFRVTELPTEIVTTLPISTYGP